jgi:small-conductance mechanosensitive channel
MLDQYFLNNPLRDWFAAIAFGVGAYALLVLVRGVVANRLQAFASRTATEVDDALAELTRATRWFFLAVVAARVGMQHLSSLPPNILLRIDQVCAILVLLQVGLWIVAFVTFLTDRTLQRRHVAGDRVGVAAIRALNVAARVVVWVALFVVMLNWTFGFNVTLLLGGLGVGGVAIAFALQQTLGDLFAALAIVFDQPFDVGDSIGVDEVVGDVERIGLKTTRLRGVNGEMIVISNADLLKSRIHNYTRMAERRVSFPVEIGLDTPAESVARVPAILEAAVLAHRPTRFVRCPLVRITDTAMRFDCVYFVLDAEYTVMTAVHHAVQLDMLRRFASEGIELARAPRMLVEK